MKQMGTTIHSPLRLITKMNKKKHIIFESYQSENMLSILEIIYPNTESKSTNLKNTVEGTIFCSYKQLSCQHHQEDG